MAVRSVVRSASASKADVSRVAGIDRTFYGRIEAGLAHPSLESLVAIATAMGADVSVRLYARTFESTLRTAFPARTRDAVDSLRSGAPWPGAAIVWIRIDGDDVELLDGPPRNVNVGR